MKVRRLFARHLGLGVAGIWLLAGAGIGGTLVLSGCVKVDESKQSPVAPDSGGSPTLKVEAASASVAPGKSVNVTAIASSKDGSAVPDGTIISFAVDAFGSIVPATAPTAAGKATATFKAGDKEGTARITVTSPDGSGTVSVKINKGDAGKGDELDPDLVSWDEPAGNVGAWPVTAKIVSASMGDRYTIVRDPMNNWPAIQEEGWSKPSIGNWWVIGKCSDGRWHAATVDWLGVGKTSMEAPYFNGKDDIHGFLATWRPRSGEVAYAMQSTHARSGVLRNNRQRTNIVKIIMP